MTDMNLPTRPVLRWHGGKWRLAPWIIAHFPPHRCYVEPFGGAASVLLRKPRSYAEVYNDLDDDLVTLFSVLRDAGAAGRLIEQLHLTPYARAEFYDARRIGCEVTDLVERARQLIVRSFMGHAGIAARANLSTGFRDDTSRPSTLPAHDWAGYPEALQAVVERFRGVLIEQRDAVQVMQNHDGPETLHYVDPPYLAETRNQRTAGKAYSHEMTDEDHQSLLDALTKLHGMVVLSGYQNPLYDAALRGWLSVSRESHADGALLRTEVLWISPAAQRNMTQMSFPFEGAVA